MPQFKLLMMVTWLPLQMLTSGSTPRESGGVGRWNTGFLDSVLDQTTGLTA